MNKLKAIALCSCLLFLGLSVNPAPCQDSEVRIPIEVAPNVINLQSEGVWVTVHAEIPYSTVAGLTVTLNEISVAYTKADNRGDLVAKFEIDQVKAILDVPNADLRLYGYTKDGNAFTGTASIGVIDVSGGK